MKHLYSLQALRAIAAISVIYYHISATPKFGAFGVDMFFVLSGFVMAMVVASNQSARIFAIHRIARIIPLYWVLTSCIFILAIIKPELLAATTANFGNYLKSLFFIPYFREDGEFYPLLLVGWSLNYEMFFYLCIWIAMSISKRYYLLLTFALMGFAYVVLGKVIDHHVLNYFFRSPLLLEFVFGMLTFFLYRHVASIKVNAFYLLIIALLNYIFMAYTEVHNSNLNRIFMWGVPAVILLMSFIYLEESIFVQYKTKLSVLLNIGDASYAIYLSHLYIVLGIKRVVSHHVDAINIYSPLGILITVVMSLIFGHLIYIFCDKPLSLMAKKMLLNSSKKVY